MEASKKELSPMAQGSQNYAIQPYRTPDSGYIGTFSPDDDIEDAMLSEEFYAVHDADAWNSNKMMAKVPPAYDVISAYFCFE